MDETAPKMAVIVAHPDDETLWAGGTMLLHPGWAKWVVALCRQSDPDRAPRFRAAVAHLGAEGRMADLDDGPEQRPLAPREVRAAMMDLVGERSYDLLLTHAPGGEYTRHLRHTEVSCAAAALWTEGRLRARRLWLFAYEDGGGAYAPRARPNAHLHLRLPAAIWREKLRLVTDTYGFTPESFEARTTPRTEAFWCFSSPDQFAAWHNRGVLR